MMKSLRAITIAGAGVLFGLTANAQTPATGYTEHDLQKQTGDTYQSGLALFRSVRADLQRAQRNDYPFPGDHYRFAQSMGDLDRLQMTWQQGSIDRAQVNQAIFQLQLVLNNNDLSTTSRASLTADLERLRDFRAQYFY
jgi:hypothetical protein